MNKDLHNLSIPALLQYLNFYYICRMPAHKFCNTSRRLPKIVLRISVRLATTTEVIKIS